MQLTYKNPAQRGVTLVELVISIVIISVGIAGILLVIQRTTQSSANPMVRHQAVAIAEAYMDEILLKPYADPDGAEPEANRTLFDDVDDYSGLTDVGARDQFNQPMPGLGNYTVNVAVTSSPPEGLNGLGGVNVMRIDVTVTGPNNTNVRLSSYRTNY
jgi:MSHA pilin protein MshD